MRTASILIAASIDACSAVYEQASKHFRYQPEFQEQDMLDGQPVTEVICEDPEYGYWAAALASELCAVLPRVSECLICGAKFVEQPDEDADECPVCGADFRD